MKYIFGGFISVAFLLLFPNYTVAEEPIVGSIKTVQGDCLIVRQDVPLAAKAGHRLHEKDILKTGGDGSSIGIILRDDTIMSLGPNSEIILHEFNFSPVEGDLSIITKLVRGTLAYLSGQIGKLSRDAVRMETPVATIGIRGTRYLAKVTAKEEGI